ncbi:MAG TPA: type VI secretion protein, partial [Streptomyces sp.]
MSSAGRLDPPMTFVLDDVAALAPLPALPDLLASGEPEGLPTLAVLRSPEQALARWQSPLWRQATLRLALDESTAASLPPAVPDAIRLA